MDLSKIPLALTFDDVLLRPQCSRVTPAEASLLSRVTSRLHLNVPFIGAPMDTVTEAPMAIALALQGCLGIIHKNLTLGEQARQVQRVRRHQSYIIENPLKLFHDESVGKAMELRHDPTCGYKTFPILDKESGALIGVLTESRWFPGDEGKKVTELMIPLAEVPKGRHTDTALEARQVFQSLHADPKHQEATYYIIIDDSLRLKGLVTLKDVKSESSYPLASKDSAGRLLVGASIGVGEEAYHRARLCLEAGASVLSVETAHGHSKNVLETLRSLRKLPEFDVLDIIAGNIATREGAAALVSAGADAVKVGIGPGSICTTRIISGIGVPQITAICEAIAGVRSSARPDVPVIADGGLRYSGDIVKAFACGASAVMAGNLFAGTDEAPGEVVVIGNRLWKIYRGMGSQGAMKAGGQDRYGYSKGQKSVPEGVEGKVPYKGSVAQVIGQLTGGVKSGFGYLGVAGFTNLAALIEVKQEQLFLRLTDSGRKESHVHDLAMVEATSNYGAVASAFVS